MPQPVDLKLLEDHRAAISCRLTKLKHIWPSILPDQGIISKLEDILPIVFNHEYPQVLTHNDLLSTNSLVDQETFEITGIIDWSLAEVLPFGMELFCLPMMTGYMALDGWHDYTCRDKLHHAFWEEFSSACTGPGNSSIRLKEAREVAQPAAKLGAVLHYAFQRSAGGSPSEEIATSESLLMFNSRLIWSQHKVFLCM